MSATVLEELLDALRAVDDLDELQGLVASNDVMDRYSPPLRDWLLDLVNTERRRRNDGGDPAYPIADFSTWTNRMFVQNANLAAVISEATIMVGNPTIQGFAMRLLQLLVGLLGVALLTLEERCAAKD